MKLVIGDTIKILSEAQHYGVNDSSVGKLAIVTHIYIDNCIKANEKGVYTWALRPCDFELFVPLGQQLLFDFMKD